MDPEAQQKFIRDCMAKLAVLEEEQADHEDALAETKLPAERREHEEALAALDTQIRGLYAAVESVMRAKRATENEEGGGDEEVVAEEWEYAKTALFAREDYTHLLQEILDEDEELRKRWNMPRSERSATRMAALRDQSAAPPKAPPAPAPAPKTPSPAAPKTPSPAAPKVPTVSAPSDKQAGPAPFRVPSVPRPGAKTPVPPSAPSAPVPAAKTPVPSPLAKEPEPAVGAPEPAPQPDDSAPTLEAVAPPQLANESQPILDPTASQTLSESRIAAAIGSTSRLKRNMTIFIGVAVVAFVAWIVWLSS